MKSFEAPYTANEMGVKRRIQHATILLLNDIQKKDFDIAFDQEGSGWQSRVCTKDPAGNAQALGATRQMFKSP